MLFNILMVPVALLFYASGLLLWPIRRWRRRKCPHRGKALGFVFLAQLLSYVAVGVTAAIKPRLLEHGYYWFIVLMELNVLFTLASVIAWIRDVVHEDNMVNGKNSST